MRRRDLVRLGTDSSGRPIRVTPLMAAWWDDFVEACESFREPFTPVIVQGPWQQLNGGGADASADTHDLASALDIRTWTLTPTQRAFLVREARRRACAMFLRGDPFDPHAHGILGPDQPKSAGAADQWLEYLGGGDGLVGSVPDRHHRPRPLVTDWTPAPKPTPNITAALKRGASREARKGALRRVQRHGRPAAQRAARGALAAILGVEAAQAKVAATRRRLRALEVRP